MQYDAIIVGGGIGGLATALSLQLAGYAVTVLERDDDFDVRKQGYGLTLTNSLSGPLAKLGLLEECVRKNTPSKCHFIFDSHGNVLGYYGRAIKELNAPISSRDSNKVKHGGSLGNLRVPRQDLRKMIIERLAEGTIQWGSRFLSYEEKDTHIEVTYSTHPSSSFEPSALNLTTLRGAVLVGADGIRSRVRDFKNKLDGTDKALSYLGVSVILGISDAPPPFITRLGIGEEEGMEQGGYYVLDGTTRLFTMPFDEQRRHIMWQLSFQCDEVEGQRIRSLRSEEILSCAEEKVSGWFAQARCLLRRSVVQEVWATPLYDLYGEKAHGGEGREGDAAEATEGPSSKKKASKSNHPANSIACGVCGRCCAPHVHVLRAGSQ